MSRSSLLSSDEVKKILNVCDFRRVTKDKLIEFVSAIPYMDRDVAIRAIEQFPVFSKFAQVMVAHYDSMCSNVLKENGEAVKATVDAYQNVLDVLSVLALKEGISVDERHFFATEMVDVADKIAALDSSNKVFLAEINRHETYIALSVILIGSVLLGVNLTCVKLPRMN